MPRVDDALGRTEELVLAMNALLVEAGVRSVSLRGACRRSGVSPASALNHYGNWDRLRALGAGLTARWRDETIRRRSGAGLRALLARLTEHELDRPALVALHAALEGLLSAMTLGEDRLDLETVGTALDRLVAVLTADARRRVQDP